MVELVALRKTNEVAAYVRASMDRKGDRWTCLLYTSDAADE